MPKAVPQSTEFETILLEKPTPEISRIVLNRPDTRNAQSYRLLYELNDAFDIAAQDADTKVIVLAANGPHFSSGHDLGDTDQDAALAEFQTIGTWCGFDCAGAEAQMSKEKELYIGLSERWRNIPKPTIAEVHGKVISGGLMLVWPCDLIVCADNTMFSDNTVGLGVGGVEYFHHPWEMNLRKAKEMLFTCDWIDAAEAEKLGMVNHVVPLDELTSFTQALAEKIAKKPAFALKLVKEALNGSQDAQGRQSAMQQAFALHQLAHTHNMNVHGMLVDPSGIQLPGLAARRKERDGQK